VIGTTRALLSTEITKLRHTSTLWLSILIPAFVLVVALIALLGEYPQWTPRPPRPLVDEWNTALRPLWTIWTAAVAPLLIAMETVGLAGPEHAGKHWKQLYTLPIPRWSIFAAKTVVCGLLVGVSFLIFGVGVLGLGLLRSGLFHLHMASGIPWGLMLRVAGRAYLASSAVIAIQMWLSMRFSGFAIPGGAGLAATVAGSVLGQIHLTGWWPWLMPFDSLPWGTAHVPASLIISPMAFVVLTVLAGWRLSRSEIV
jgi:lantibiotic transport system permease protein